MCKSKSKGKVHHSSKQLVGKASPKSRDLKKRKFDDSGNKDFDNRLSNLKARMTGPKKRNVQKGIPLAQPTFEAPSLVVAAQAEKEKAERRKVEKAAIDSLFDQSDSDDDDNDNNNNVKMRRNSEGATATFKDTEQGWRNRFHVLDVDGEVNVAGVKKPVLAPSILSTATWVDDPDL